MWKVPKKSFQTVVIQILLPALVWLCLWQSLATTIGQELLLPSPTQVAKTLGRLWLEPFFWEHMFASLLRISLGIAIGTLGGIAVALCTWKSPPAYYLISPPLKVIQATPVVSFILLLLLWLPRNYVPATISCLMILPLLWSNTTKGLEQTSPQLIEFSKAYQISPIRQWKLLYLPSILPFIRSGLSVGIGLGWKSGVAAEVICRPPLALGTQMSDSKLYFDTPSLFAWTVVVIVLSTLMEKLLLGLLPSPKSQEVTP